MLIHDEQNPDGRPATDEEIASILGDADTSLAQWAAGGPAPWA